MQPSIEALLSQKIDYAGLFPPARLEMAPSVDEYLRTRNGSDSWILNRFVCPSSRLWELGEVLASVEVGQPVSLSTIGRGGAHLSEFETHLEIDAKEMTAFEEAFGDLAIIEALELKCPTGSDLPKALKDLGAFRDIEVFAELPMSEVGITGLVDVAATEWIGAKGRTGGVEAAMVPSAESLSAFLQSCLDLDLDFKLTAGLHEPDRHFDPHVGAELHGFINIIGACLLHLDEGLSVSEFAGILVQTELSWCRPNGESALVAGREVPSNVVNDLSERFRGWGSCSIREPLDGLARIGWL